MDNNKSINCIDTRVKENFKTDHYQGLLPGTLSKRIRKFCVESCIKESSIFHLSWAIIISQCCDQENIRFTSALPIQSLSNKDNRVESSNKIQLISINIKLAKRRLSNALNEINEQLMKLTLSEERVEVIENVFNGNSVEKPYLSSLLNCIGIITETNKCLEGITSKKNEVEKIHLQERFNNIPLTVSINNINSEFNLSIQSPDTFHPQRIFNFFVIVLREILSICQKNKYKLVAQVSILNRYERNFLLHTLNHQKTNNSKIELIHEFFEVQAKSFPNNVAMIFMHKEMTYKVLNESANRLSHALKEQGVSIQSLVGVCIDRSFEMMIAIIAILKAGAAYVPLDPSYPQARLQAIVADTDLKHILTKSNIIRKFTFLNNINITEIDNIEHKQSVLNFPDTNPQRTADQCSSNLAYVIYTSGSTGKPKGVMVEHGNIIGLIHWSRKYFSDDELACVLASTTLNFDLSVFEMFVPLASGNRILIVNSILSLIDGSCRNKGITLINTVPSGIQAIVNDNMIPKSVIIINLCGEILRKSLANELRKNSNVKRVVNLYGPSEDTVYSTAIAFTTKLQCEPSIGKPIDNKQVYILNKCAQIVPYGVVGELYIGGVGVARGYYKRPKLTGDRFIQNPFNSISNDRLYKTGDLVRFNQDGNIEFIGRIDDQVKVHGFRIELSEVEHHLSANIDVQSSIVVVQEDDTGYKRLVAYVLINQQIKYTEDVLIEQLMLSMQQKLPKYMLPSAIIIIEQWPLTLNGKIDKNKLPLFSGSWRESDCTYLDNDIEQVLVNICAELLKLKIEDICIYTSFFDLGAHSLMATSLGTRISHIYSVKITLHEMFIAKSIRNIANLVDSKIKNNDFIDLDSKVTNVISVDNLDIEELIL